MKFQMLNEENIEKQYYLDCGYIVKDNPVLYDQLYKVYRYGYLRGIVVSSDNLTKKFTDAWLYQKKVL